MFVGEAGLGLARRDDELPGVNHRAGGGRMVSMSSHRLDAPRAHEEGPRAVACDSSVIV